MDAGSTSPTRSRYQGASEQPRSGTEEIRRLSLRTKGLGKIKKMFVLSRQLEVLPQIILLVSSDYSEEVV